jgi:hypothetical protein
MLFRRGFLDIGRPRKSVRREDTTDLLNLIRLCLAAVWLEIEDFCHTIASEDVVIAADSLIEAQVVQQSAKVTKADIGVRIPSENSVQRLRDLTHSLSSSIALRKNTWHIWTGEI